MPVEISVLVYLHSTLVKYSPDGKTRKFTINLSADSTLEDLLISFGISPDEQHLLLAVNGKVANQEQILNDEDYVHLMMPISGG